MALVDQPFTIVEDVNFRSLIEHIVLCSCFSQSKLFRRLFYGIAYSMIKMHFCEQVKQISSTQHNNVFFYYYYLLVHFCLNVLAIISVKKCK